MPSLRDRFLQRFGRPPAVVARAPGRVNLIGEHTDYNEGFVLPMALGQCTWVAAAPRDDGQIRAVAEDLADEQAWTAGVWTADRYPHWTAYVAGVAALLARRGARVPGCDLLIASDVPVGGGLSSSAALEVACALAFARLADLNLEGRELADLCRAAEREFAGVPCGIMDQYVSVFAQPGCAFWLDCRARTWEHVPLPLGEHVVLIVNSGVHHELATSAYARRQAECRAAVECLRAHYPTTVSLRDVPLTLLADAALPDNLLRRARHVVTENVRTCAAVDALRRGDLLAFGRQLDESHASLRDDYEVSCRELDLLVEIVRGVPGVLGARLTGGGFGGCIVALAPRASVPCIEQTVRSAYDSCGYGPATVLLSAPGSGAALG